MFIELLEGKRCCRANGSNRLVAEYLVGTGEQFVFDKELSWLDLHQIDAVPEISILQLTLKIQTTRWKL